MLLLSVLTIDDVKSNFGDWTDAPFGIFSGEMTVAFYSGSNKALVATLEESLSIMQKENSKNLAKSGTAYYQEKSVGYLIDNDFKQPNLVFKKATEIYIELKNEMLINYIRLFFLPPGNKKKQPIFTFYFSTFFFLDKTCNLKFELKDKNDKINQECSIIIRKYWQFRAHWHNLFCFGKVFRFHIINEHTKNINLSKIYLFYFYFPRLLTR